MLMRKFRMTHRRQVILEELRKVKTHPTADEVYEMVRRRLPRISLGTVYRNLEILSDTGMIQKLEIGGTQKRFDAEPQNHYHVRCVRCGRVEDTHVDLLTDLDDAIRKEIDYEIIGHRLEFQGVCPQCRKEEGSPAK